MSNKLYEKFKDLSQESLNEYLLLACKINNLKTVKYLLTSPELKIHADIHTRDDLAFRSACLYGYSRLAHYLLTSPELKEKADIHAENDAGLTLAATYEYEKLVKYLLCSPKLKEHADVSANDSNALKEACKVGNLNIVKFLLSSPKIKKHADIKAQNNICFINALSLGHIEVAQYLLTFDEVRNHPNINKHKEKIFGYAVAHIKVPDESDKRMRAIKFLIFDLDIERTQQIDNYFADNVFAHKIAEWFALKELNKSLKEELVQNSNHISRPKSKL